MTSPEEFKALTRKIAADLELDAKEIHLRPMTKKWASCSSRGRLTFNPELLDKSRERQIEVILHELLHQKYATHNKMFKLLMNTYLEKYNK